MAYFLNLLRTSDIKTTRITSYTDFEVINVSNIFLCIFYQLLKYVGFMQDKMYLFVIRLRKNNVVIIDLFCLPIFFLKIK